MNIILWSTLFLILLIICWGIFTQQNFTHKMNSLFQQQQQQFSEHQLHNLKILTDSLNNGMQTVHTQLNTELQRQNNELHSQFQKLTTHTEQKLTAITQQVDAQLANGFAKTTETFTDIVKRLALIDEAQKKISTLSSDIISLQEILTDKRARGAFGEIQLSVLLHNVLPSENFALQYVLSNDKRADCILFLPPPTGNIVIDAKFPLENYQRALDDNLSIPERTAAKQQFQKDIKKHLQDIATKYIIPGETADSAIMFIPAEAIFAEIHSHYPELVTASHKAHVWLTSPSTLMAILTTARAVIKDNATRQQVDLIQEHLIALGKDFSRFQNRIDNLVKHINLAATDVNDMNISAKKITSRFQAIETVKLTKLAEHEQH